MPLLSLSLHSLLQRLGLALALFGAFSAGPASAQDLAVRAGSGKGVAVVIGGALSNENHLVWERMVALAGGAGSRWVVLGTASESPTRSAEQAVRQLSRRGAVATVLPVSPLLPDRPVAEAVRDPELLAQVRAAKGVFFTGGAQERIVSSLRPGGQASPLLQAIWALYRAGGVVAGTSAGAAIMSSTMFVDAPNTMGVLKGRFDSGKEVGEGLGFVGSELFIDQHFLRRGRIGRMLPVMQARGMRLGLGVEENAAAAVRGDQVEMLGGQALFVDLTEARSNPALGVFNIQGVRLSLLDTGDRIDLLSRVLIPVAHKAAGQTYDPSSAQYKPYHKLAPVPADILANRVLSTAMGLLIDGNFNEVRGLSFDPRARDDDPQAALGFEWRLYKAPGSVGWTSDEGGGEDYTVHRLALDVDPVRMARPLFAPWSASR